MDQSHTIFACAAVFLLGSAVMLPNGSSIQGRFFGFIVLAVLMTWIVLKGRDDAATRTKELEHAKLRAKKGVTAVVRSRFASVHGDAYGLRVPNHDKEAYRAMSKAIKYGLVPSKIVALAARVNNQGAARRLVAALLDIRARCKYIDRRAERGERVPKPIQTRVAHEIDAIRASHKTVMDALQELTMRLPGGAIAKEYSGIVRTLNRDLTAFIKASCKRWDWCLSARMASADNGCDHKNSPIPYDASRSLLLYP